MFLAVFEKKWWSLSKKTNNTPNSYEINNSDGRDYNEGIYDDIDNGDGKLMSDNENDKLNFDPSVASSSINPYGQDENDISSDKLKTELSVDKLSVDNSLLSDKNFHLSDNTESISTIDNESSSDEEIFSNTYEEADSDPLSEAFELLSNQEEDDEFEEEQVKFNIKISNPKEFFDTEILKRFDHLDNEDRNYLSGSYRIEIRGANGGLWSLNCGNELRISSNKEDAELVMMLNSDDFISLVNGKMNPQLALASRRIKINGDSRKAVLFQNLLVPKTD